VTESALTLEFLREDGFSLETPFGWGIMTAGQEGRGALDSAETALTLLAFGCSAQRTIGDFPSGADLADKGVRAPASSRYGVGL